VIDAYHALTWHSSQRDAAKRIAGTLDRPEHTVRKILRRNKLS
jgi:hypothetical protein